jgi:hypothetical protein
MRAINNPDVLERTAVRADVGAIAIALIAYLIITSLASIVIIFFAVRELNGIIYPASSAVALAFMWIILRDNMHLREVFEETREIPGRVFRNAFFCIAGLQPIFMFIGRGIEELYTKAGYSVDLSVFDPKADGVAFIIINLVVVKPVVEGILFRGVVLRVLSAYGRTFAIIASAILFGLYQENILQIGSSFFAGLALGYITFRYSIKWSIVLHTIYNGLIIAIAYLSPALPGFVVYGIWGVFLVGLVCVAITKHAKVRRFLDKGRTRKNAWRYTFTVPWLLLYIAITVVLTIVQMKVYPLDKPENPGLPPLIPDIWG